jgi:ribose transport system permease protein
MAQTKRAVSLWRWAPTIVLVALIALFAMINPNFLNATNFARISTVAAPALMVAIGASFIIIMGSIDLSMEGIIATAAVIFGTVFVALGGSISAGYAWLAIPVTIVTAAALGGINGALHVKLKIPSFMSSLAMGFAGTGIALLITTGERIQIADPGFRTLLTYKIYGFPLMAYVAFGCTLLAWFVQEKTILGRNFYAVGGGEDLAYASGLNVGRVRMIGFALAGIFYGIAALLAVARLGMAETTTGANYMFLSITAVVVGGTSLMGGVGGVWNTVVGVLIVNVISNGMVVVGLPRYLQDGVLGILIIAAVVLATDRKTISLIK